MFISNVATHGVQLAHSLWQYKFAFSAACTTYLLARQTVKYLNSPFRKQRIPGPFLAKFTNFYRGYYTLKRTWHRDLMALHDKYGTVVWVAPNEISCSDPFLRNQIYSFANDKKEETFFRKAPSYETGTVNEDFNFIFERDPEKARLGKKYMSHFYSEAYLTKIEGNFDQAVNEFIQGMDQHIVNPGKVCNLTSWIEYYMWDATTQIACNLSSGFCLAGKDLWGTLFGLRVIVQVVGCLMPIPQALMITTRWIRKMLLLYFLDQLYFTATGIGAFKWKRCLGKRIEEVRTEAPAHLIAKFHNAQANMRGSFPLGDTTQGCTVQLFNLIAGAVGVGTHPTVKAIHQLIENPKCLARVREELSALGGDFEFSAFVHRGGSNKVPYLEAVVNEAIRLAPAAGFTLSRISPPAGCQLNEFFVPPGYIVGMSAWPVNYDTGYFGPDAAEFKPERWLGNHPTQTIDGRPRTMINYIEAGWLSFGAGGRVCIGRHLAVFMMVKVLAKLFMEYDLELVKAPEESFALVVELTGMQVMAKRREISVHQ